jgi:hypothetical protein
LAVRVSVSGAAQAARRSARSSCARAARYRFRR